jgi:hypothetical protein
MKSKLLNILLILSSSIGYLSWGKNQSSFLFEVEFEIFKKLLTTPKSMLHPLILLPLFGQIILLATLFQVVPSKKLTYVGMIGLAILMSFILLVGILSFQIKIMMSTIPFFILSIITLRK